VSIAALYVDGRLGKDGNKRICGWEMSGSGERKRSRKRKIEKD
jgi:hypothetical protein